MPILSEAERRKEVLNYISVHQGCLKEEACDALVSKLSRATFFKDLPKLIKEGKVIEKPKNKRDTMLFIDKNNPLIYVPEQIEEFERAYKQLLKASKKKIKEKNFTQISKTIKASQSDPSKWTEEECFRFAEYEIEMMDQTNARLNESTQTLNKLTKSINCIQSIDKTRLNSLKEVYTHVDQIARIEIEEDSLPEIINHEVGTLMRSSVMVFFSLIDAVTYLSILWPKIIQDKEHLRKLYSNVFSKISDIQMELSSFLISFRVFWIYDPVDYLMKQKDPRTETLVGITRVYRTLKLQNEFALVMNSLNQICRGLREYGYNVGTDPYEESRLECIVQLNKLKKWLQQFEKLHSQIEN